MTLHTFTITDYGADYAKTRDAQARYAICNHVTKTLVWTNDPKIVRDYAIQFVEIVTKQQQQP